MSAKTAHPRIIIVKKHVASHDDEHGGAWKVAYADFVTAMMALFIVLWLLSASEKVQKAVGGYFQDPTGKGRQTGSTTAGVGEVLTLNQNQLQLLKEKLEQAMRQIPAFQNMAKQIRMTITAEGLRIDLLETPVEALTPVSDERSQYWRLFGQWPDAGAVPLTSVSSVGDLP